MAPIVDQSWPRMGSGFQNPFQNVPGRFIPALPDLRSLPSFGPSTSSASLPPHSPLGLKGKGRATPFARDESDFNRDACPDTTQGEEEHTHGDACSEPDDNPRSDSRTLTPSPSSPTSTTSSGQGHTTEKTKRTRRRRHRYRNRPQAVDFGGCVMGPRMVHLPAHVPFGIVSLTQLSPGYPVATAPGGGPRFEPQAVPGY